MPRGRVVFHPAVGWVTRRDSWVWCDPGLGLGDAQRPAIMNLPKSAIALDTSDRTSGLTQRSAKRRVADVVIDTLMELGIDTFYGIPGGAIASVYDSLIDHPKARVINTRHETGATFMAMGHSRVGGSL